MKAGRVARWVLGLTALSCITSMGWRWVTYRPPLTIDPRCALLAPDALIEPSTWADAANKTGPVVLEALVYGMFSPRPDGTTAFVFGGDDDVHSAHAARVESGVRVRGVAHVVAIAPLLIDHDNVLVCLVYQEVMPLSPAPGGNPPRRLATRP